ncbi:hypothetical protein OK016_10370 [Vibrio chagasii]|nr:hypothetical protein [Vibrio chagasii]
MQWTFQMGKDMSKVSYKFPVKPANYDDLVTSSPISTLIEKELGGQPYTEATGVQVLTDLGLDGLLNNGVTSVADFPGVVHKKLLKTFQQKMLA